MKCYAIFPVFRLKKDDARSLACIDLISKVTVEALRQGGDEFHYAVDWLNPGDAPNSGGFNADIAQPHIRQFINAPALMQRIQQSIDPYNGMWSTVRSIATCRMATFGYDGQAFLCLRHEDRPPVIGDASLAVVEERPDLITQTDYFDGFVPGDEAPANDR